MMTTDIRHTDIISTEIQIPEALFRKLQRLLDDCPTLSWDEVLIEALSRYLLQSPSGQP